MQIKEIESFGSIFKQLKGTFDLKFLLQQKQRSNIWNLEVCEDSDLAGDEITRVSTCLMNFRRQYSVAESSTTVEYMALHESVKERSWLRSLGRFIKIKCKNPTIIYEHNDNCINIANNPKSSKHLDVNITLQEIEFKRK